MNATKAMVLAEQFKKDDAVILQRRNPHPYSSYWDVGFAALARNQKSAAYARYLLKDDMEMPRVGMGVECRLEDFCDVTVIRQIQGLAAFGGVAYIRNQRTATAAQVQETANSIREDEGPRVRVSAILKKGSIIFGTVFLASIVTWAGWNQVLINPLLALLGLFALPFFYWMGTLIEREQK